LLTLDFYQRADSALEIVAEVVVEVAEAEAVATATWNQSLAAEAAGDPLLTAGASDSPASAARAVVMAQKASKVTVSDRRTGFVDARYLAVFL
jgi:hypothetical protein